MNYLQHPNLLVQFWASLNTEFDKILDNFCRMDGWLFQDLGIAAKKANLGTIHRSVCALVNSNHGREDRVDHWIRVNFVLLDAAKTQWLVPWRKYVVDPSNGVIPPFLKRQVGGFFLLYMLYINQPVTSRFQKTQRIIMDPTDLLAMHVFTATLQRLPKTDDQFRELARQVVVIFNDLIKSEAFEFSAFNDTFVTPVQSIRQLLTSKFCMFTKMIYSVKDLRDQLFYITYQESLKVFQSLVAYGKFLPENQAKSNILRNKNQITNKDDEKFHPTDKNWTVDEIKALENENDCGKLAHNVTCILKSLDFGPILTRERMIGICDNLLDKELRHCAKNHQSHLKRSEECAARSRTHKHASHTARGRNPKSELSTLKKYLSGNNAWIDDIFLYQQKTVAAESSVDENNACPSTEIDNLEEIIDIQYGDDEEDDEWLTDQDPDDIEITEGKSVASTPRVKIANNVRPSPKKKSPSPRKRSHRYPSMPMI